MDIFEYSDGEQLIANITPARPFVDTLHAACII